MEVHEYWIQQNANFHQWKREAVVGVQLHQQSSAVAGSHLMAVVHDLKKPLVVTHCQGKLTRG